MTALDCPNPFDIPNHNENNNYPLKRVSILIQSHATDSFDHDDSNGPYSLKYHQQLALRRDNNTEVGDEPINYSHDHNFSDNQEEASSMMNDNSNSLLNIATPNPMSEIKIVNVTSLPPEKYNEIMNNDDNAMNATDSSYSHHHLKISEIISTASNVFGIAKKEVEEESDSLLTVAANRPYQTLRNQSSKKQNSKTRKLRQQMQTNYRLSGGHVQNIDEVSTCVARKNHQHKPLANMPIAETFGENEKCSICKLSEIDSLNYGDIHTTKELTVHLFCLYFSTNLPQRGKDNAGIVGFKLRDIRNLIKTSAKQKCCYCRGLSATTHCHFPKCGRVFHQVCGFKKYARFEYLDEFRTFCDIHNRIEHETTEFRQVMGCFICSDILGDYHPVKTIPSCCGKWFHQQCLRSYAINARYAFMCPICRNENYGDFARRHGIYVPEYEVLWEKTHDYAVYTHCDAIDCVCPGGRTFTNKKWNFQFCSCCGAFGFHILCLPKEESKHIIVCDICGNVTQPTSQPNEPQIIHEEAEELVNQNKRVDANQQVDADEDLAMVDPTSDNEIGMLERNIVPDVLMTDLTSNEIEILERNAVPGVAVDINNLDELWDQKTGL